MTTMEKIKKYAEQLGWNISENDDKTGYWLQEGSTFVDIFPKDNKSLPELLVFSRVVEGARIDLELTQKLLKLNSVVRAGAFCLTEDNVILFKVSIVGGDHMDIDEFRNAVEVVAIIADEYDDKIISTHGGKTALTAIQENFKEQNSNNLLAW